jgi:hypothetical protein
VGRPCLRAKGRKLMNAARYFFTFPVADASGPRVYLSAKEAVGKELFQMTANQLHEIQASNPVAQFFHARSDWKPLNQGHRRVAVQRHRAEHCVEVIQVHLPDDNTDFRCAYEPS